MPTYRVVEMKMPRGHSIFRVQRRVLFFWWRYCRYTDLAGERQQRIFQTKAQADDWVTSMSRYKHTDDQSGIYYLPRKRRDRKHDLRI